MKKLFCALLIIIIACSVAFCGFVPACGGIGYFISNKKVRKYLDDMAEALKSPEYYTFGVDRYEEIENADPNGVHSEIVYRSYYVFNKTLSYYELDFKTGNAAFYYDGVLEKFDKASGEKTISQTSDEEVYSRIGMDAVLETVRAELAKPVQQKHAGYHHILTNSTLLLT